MPPDYRDLPTITDRSFDVSFYEGSASTSREAFEGRTTHLSRRHLRAFVNDIGSHGGGSGSSREEYWQGRTVTTAFHALSSALDEVSGEVALLQPAEDRRHRWLLEVVFAREINLLELRL